MNLLVELTSAKADSYKHMIEDSLCSSKLLGNDKEISSLYFPISAVKDSCIEYRYIAQNQPTDLIDKIKESISQMIDDHSATGIVKGISSINNSALQQLLGLASGMKQYCASTITFIEGTGITVNIMRMNCIIWGRTISAESIKQQINKTFACVAYKSVVNVKQLTFSDFRAVYAPVIEASGETNPVAAHKKVKEIYDLHRRRIGVEESGQTSCR